MGRQAIVWTVLTLGAAALAVPVDAQYFGRNKVQYRAFDFQVLRTDHFDVYYYPEEREAAVDAARMVERAYARLSRILQHEFRERKPLIIYASHTDFQQTNALPSFIDEGTGGVTEALKNRMILPFTGSYAHFDHVLNHELVHAFQFDVIFRRGIMTDAVPLGARLPLWFMEGMAEYLSVGVIDPLTKSWLRDAVLGGYLRSIDEMNQRDDYLSYRFGQSLWSYIGARWGDEVVGILLQKAPRVGLERAFASTLGTSLEELSQEWTSAVRQEYLPQVAEYHRPESFAKKLTTHDELFDPWFLSPALSPDGEKVVYLSQRDGFFFDLWLADARTGAVERKLVSAARDANFESLRYMSSGASFSPDGRWVAFAAQTGGRDALYLYDLERKRVAKKLRFELSGISGPSWSPDGRSIVFSGLSGGLSDLYITDIDGNLRRLTDDRFADLMPAWSPDGRWIAFTTDRGRRTNLDDLSYGNLRVALYDLESGAMDFLPHQEEGKNVNPVWSPDGRSLVWVSDRTGTNNLYLFERAGDTLHRISDLLSGVIAITPESPVISWSRTGTLAFVYFENAGYNIYTVQDPRTLSRIPVAPTTVAAAPNNGEGASPDGERLNGDSTALRSAASSYRQPFVGSFYRQGNRFRPSNFAGERPAVGSGPVSVVALLDSAALALPDTMAFEHRDYNVKFTPDMIGRPTIGAQVGGYYGNGLYGGSYISLSDMLGNHNIVAALAINGSFSDATFLTGYSFLKTRLNWSAAISQIPLYRYLGTGYVAVEGQAEDHDALADVFLRDVVRSAQLSASYPVSTYRRIELGASAVHYQTDVLYFGYDRQTGEPLDQDRSLDALGYVQPMAALVFDNSLFGWTGPIYGRRYRLQVSQTVGGLHFTEGLVDLRNYWNIARRVVFAGRVLGLARRGPDSDRFPLFWGGPYFLRGYDGGSFDPDGAECSGSRTTGTGSSISGCPARDQLIGASAAFLNVEVRVPVISELQIGFLGSFPPVDAVAFFDAGLAWDERVCRGANIERYDRCLDGETVHIVWDRKPGQDPYLYREPLLSYGLGLRVNVFYTVLRMDYALPLNRPDRSGRFSLSFGPSF
jgi:Tol biopolymer transport system component